MSTAEFLDVKERLTALTRRGKEAGGDPNRPKLRRAPSGGTVPVEEGDLDSDADAGDEDDRPTLKRR